MASLKLSECVCPICLCILVEPVTMPCQHELCMPCFKQNVEQANLTCPMCRLRISNWARKQAGRLINQERWRSIQNAFPELCQKRMECGEEEEDDVLDLMTQPPPPVVLVAEPGEIGEEFKKEREKLREEYRQEHEAAVKKSEEYIRQLQREEVRSFERRQEEQLSQEKQDAELARRLAEQGDQGDVIHMGEKVLVMREQVMRDEELARRLQMSEQSLSSPPLPTSPDIVVINSSSSGSLSKKSGASSSSSSIKCLSIEKFLSPAGRRSKSPDRKRERGRSDFVAGLEDQPSTSSHSPVSRRAAESAVPRRDPARPARPHGAFSPVLKTPRLRELDESHLRAHSTDSNDSISGEMNHFKPIHVSPRTAHKKLPDGRAESPPIVFTTPRNLRKMDEDAGSISPVQMSSFMKARWKDLEAERTREIYDASKATMTGLARHAKKQLSWQQQQRNRANRVGDRGDAQDGPPEKRVKVEHLPGAEEAAAALPGVVDLHQKRREGIQQERPPKDCRVKAALQMRLAEPEDANHCGKDECDGGETTDYNHNCNNSRTLEEKVKDLAMEKLKGSASEESSENGCVSERLQGKEDNGTSSQSKKGKDEGTKVQRKKIKTPFKEYSMREHTKLQTKVTNSLKDMFNARRSRNKGVEENTAANVLDPPLPSLEKAEALDSAVNGHVSSRKAQREPCGSISRTGPEDEQVQRAIRASQESNPASSANGSGVPAASVDTQRRGMKGGSQSGLESVEVSYEDWLSSNGCQSTAMQDGREATGSTTLCDDAKCKQSSHCEKVGMGSIRESDVASKNNGIDGKMRVATSSGVEGEKEVSSQDSDISMASVDLGESSCRHGSDKWGKLARSDGISDSSQSSGDTISRYLELLSEERERLRQEEEDRLLAERLQRELDKESRRQREGVDRSKGTEDAYQLRRKQRSLYQYLE